MAGIERRLQRLEAESRTAVDENAWKQLWLNAKRGKRVREHRNPDESHAGGIFRLLRLQERLATTREEVEAQILSWRPPPSEVATRRVVARAIFDQEEGIENMVCPPEWRGSFAAGEEWRETWKMLSRWKRDAEAGSKERTNERSTNDQRDHRATEGQAEEAR